MAIKMAFGTELRHSLSVKHVSKFRLTDHVGCGLTILCLDGVSVMSFRLFFTVLNEVQVYVHDLHTFVTVQLLEDTPAVFFLGKPCKEHDYTYEWPSDREQRLTNYGNQTLNRTEKVVPLVGPGLSSSSASASSSTSPPQDLSVSLDPENTRSNEGATGNCSEGVAGNCSEGIPPWLQDFTENLEIAETLAAAYISHDSDLERPTKVAPRKHSIYVHFPKDRNC